ncbi:MAG: alpha/beta fold hydrolase [Pseudomonadales bacterium]|jgi:pimeloyl-ACP methyl ester carboxylesterase|nr:alpha/beta fold hydrolase [Pseudomonadales bacterium]
MRRKTLRAGSLAAGLGLVLSACVGITGCAAQGSRWDPATMDPPAEAQPPSMASARIPSGDVAMNAIVYTPAGPGPHPVALLLHGLPGDERNLDLAQAIRRAGWSVVFFHYRGAWGSPGDFSFHHVLEDVDAAVAWTRTDEVRERFAFDDAPRALVGHSMGGFAALAAGAGNADVGCIASLAGANMGLMGAALRDDAALADASALTLAYDTAGPLAGTSGLALVAELASSAAEFDLRRRVPELARRKTLLVAALADRYVPVEQHHTPLVLALRDAGADVRDVELPTDHAFSGSRIALARALISWLREDCP